MMWRLPRDVARNSDHIAFPLKCLPSEGEIRKALTAQYLSTYKCDFMGTPQGTQFSVNLMYENSSEWLTTSVHTGISRCHNISWHFSLQFIFHLPFIFFLSWYFLLDRVQWHWKSSQMVCTYAQQAPHITLYWHCDEGQLSPAKPKIWTHGQCFSLLQNRSKCDLPRYRYCLLKNYRRCM